MDNVTDFSALSALNSFEARCVAWRGSPEIEAPHRADDLDELKDAVDGQHDHHHHCTNTGECQRECVSERESVSERERERVILTVRQRIAFDGKHAYHHHCIPRGVL
jgi:hypothetical protein